ncbi:MAG: hypothetical protein Q8S84_03340 [bacterium]|nr:hypothetical protein [bacterium]MDP3380559.1 hypothetical protein [bacterium]
MRSFFLKSAVFFASSILSSKLLIGSQIFHVEVIQVKSLFILPVEVSHVEVSITLIVSFFEIFILEFSFTLLSSF